MKASRTTATIIGLFGALTLAGLIASALSPIYRSAYGNMKGLGDFVFRFAPDTCLLAFYAFLGYSIIRHNRLNRLLIVLHSGLFLVLGIGLAVPYLGHMLSLITPVAVVYISMILHVSPEYGMVPMVSLAVAFSFANAWLLFAALNYPRLTARVSTDSE